MISVIIFSAELLDSASVPESEISDCFINVFPKITKHFQTLPASNKNN